MRKNPQRLVCLLLALALAAGCAARKPDVPAYGPYTGPPPTECPEGHDNLREVPILGGYVPGTEETRQKVDFGEIIVVGCFGAPDRIAYGCRDCGRTWRQGYWSRRPSDQPTNIQLILLAAEVLRPLWMTP